MFSSVMVTECVHGYNIHVQAASLRKVASRNHEDTCLSISSLFRDENPELRSLNTLDAGLKAVEDQQGEKGAATVELDAEIEGSRMQCALFGL